MSGRDDPRLPKRTVDYIQDIVGADVSRNLIRVAIVAQDLGQLDVSAAEVDVDINSQTLSQIASNIEQIGGEPQSAVDVAAKIDQIQAALTSVGNDSLRVSSPNPLDVSAVTVPIQEDTPLDVSGEVVPISEDTPLDVTGKTVPVAVKEDDAGGGFKTPSVTVEAGEIYTIEEGEKWYVNDLVADGKVYVEGSLIHYGSISGTGEIKGSGSVIAKE